MSNAQIQFIRILQDECTTKQGTYRIVTSIYDLIYRNEIFLDNILIDALEEECYYLAYDVKKEESFKHKYLKAHQATKEKYCPQKKETSSKANKAWVSFKIPDLNYTNYLLVILGLLLTFVLIYTIKDSVDSPGENEILLNTPKENTSYKQDTIKIPHEDNAKTNTPEDLQDVLPEPIPTELVTNKEPFVWLPKEDFVIDAAHYFALSFTNNSDKNVQIQLTGRSLNESPYDEIVQFKESDITARLKAKEAKVFQIYIEPTYYKQFNKGRYTGTLTFTLDYEENKKTFDKHFSFEVK